MHATLARGGGGGISIDPVLLPATGVKMRSSANLVPVTVVAAVAIYISTLQLLANQAVVYHTSTTLIL